MIVYRALRRDAVLLHWRYVCSGPPAAMGEACVRVWRGGMRALRRKAWTASDLVSLCVCVCGEVCVP